MSNYYSTAKNPKTNNYEYAEFLDDYFAHHEYGVMFADGNVYPIDEIEIKKEEESKPEKIEPVSYNYGSSHNTFAAILSKLNEIIESLNATNERVEKRKSELLTAEELKSALEALKLASMLDDKTIKTAAKRGAAKMRGEL